MKAGSIQLQTDVAKAAFDESGLRLAPVCDIQVHVTGPDSPDALDHQSSLVDVVVRR